MSAHHAWQALLYAVEVTALPARAQAVKHYTCVYHAPTSNVKPCATSMP
jgi:hypothetical protein